MISELKKVVEENGASHNKGHSGGATEGELNNLANELNKLKNEFNGFREDTSGNMKFLNDSLGMKADKNELLDLEARIMEKLNEIIKNLLG